MLLSVICFFKQGIGPRSMLLNVTKIFFEITEVYKYTIYIRQMSHLPHRQRYFNPLTISVVKVKKKLTGSW